MSASGILAAPIILSALSMGASTGRPHGIAPQTATATTVPLGSELTASNSSRATAPSGLVVS